MSQPDEAIARDRQAESGPAGSPDRSAAAPDRPARTAAQPAPGAAPPPPPPAAAAAPSPPGDDLGTTVAALVAEDVPPAGRRRHLDRLAELVRPKSLAQLFRPRLALQWMAETTTQLAPHVPVRDLQTLRRHHDDLDDEALAERLVRNAALATTGVGAVGGGLASLEWVVTPTLLSAPVLLAAETLAVVVIELKLVGELHEVYRQPIPGNVSQRATAMVQAWAGQRGVNPMLPGVGIGTILGTAARQELRDRLLRRFGRNVTTFGPMLTGAAVASYLNRRATRALGERIRADLRRQRPTVAVRSESGPNRPA